MRLIAKRYSYQRTLSEKATSPKCGEVPRSDGGDVKQVQVDYEDTDTRSRVRYKTHMRLNAKRYLGRLTLSPGKYSPSGTPQRGERASKGKTSIETQKSAMPSVRPSSIGGLREAVGGRTSRNHTSL